MSINQLRTFFLACAVITTASLAGCDMLSSKLSYAPDAERIRFAGVKSIIPGSDGQYILSWDKPDSTAIDVAHYEIWLFEMNDDSLSLTGEDEDPGQGGQDGTQNGGIVINLDPAKVAEMQGAETGTGKVLGTITGSLSFTIDSLLPGNYGFLVQAYDNGGVPDGNSSVLLLTVGFADYYLGIVDAQVVGDQVQVSWAKFETKLKTGQNVKYIVYENTNNFPFNNPIDVIDGADQTSASYGTIGKAPGSEWFYAVRVQDPAGRMHENYTVRSVVIEEPSDDYQGCVKGDVLGSSQVQLTFAWPGGAADLMNIYRNGALAFSASDKGQTTFRDVGLLEGEKYEYSCEFVLADVRYKGSNIVTLTTLSTNPPTFAGIAGVTVQGPRAIAVNWGVASGVPSAYFAVFANPGNTVEWGAEPIKLVEPSELTAALDVGDELQYALGVRACTQNDVCDTNTVTLTATTPDGGAPLSPGIKEAAMVEGKLVVKADWNHAYGGITKRFVYLYMGGGDPSDFANYTAPPKSFLVNDPVAPPIELVVENLQEKTDYHLIVRDEDSHGNKSTNTKHLSINTGDLTAPGFTGITSLLLGAEGTREDSLVAGFTAIASEAAASDGASHYMVYTMAGGGDACVDGTMKTEFSALPFTQGTAYEYVIEGLQSRTMYSICLKVRDGSGNVSSTDGYLSKSTIDETAPNFDGLQTINYSVDTGLLSLAWVQSTSADIMDYQVNIWKNTTTPTDGEILTLMVSHNTNASGLEFSNTTFDFGSNDQVYVMVNACDNAGFIPGGSTNCTDFVQTSALDITLADIDPPPGFAGISAATELVATTEGEVTIKWIAPADWTDYSGFKIYTVSDDMSLEFIKLCACASVGCPGTPTSCDVTGLDPYRTYTFHVRAYDEAGNLTLLDTETRSSPKRVADTTPPSFSSNLSLEYAAGSTHLEWEPATDNQYESEPGATITYEVYRKTDTTFDNPMTPNTDGVADLLSAKPDLFIDDNKDYTSGTKYYYSVCVKDGTGNRRCDGNIKWLETPDLVPPTIGSLTTDKVGDMKTWTLNWTMSDNKAGDLLVKIRKVVGDSPDDPVSDADETIFSAYNATTKSGLYGPADVDKYVNYQLSVEDDAGNISTAMISVFSTNYIDVTEVKSNEGPMGGGKLIVLNGNGFHPNTTIKIGENFCSQVDFISREKIMCYSPTGPEASVDVTVANTDPDGSSYYFADGYTYCSAVNCTNICNRPTNEWSSLANYAEGTGGLNDPYVICNDTQLDNVRSFGHGKAIKLGDNIDLISWTNNSFDPISTSSYQTYMHVDGDGYAVANYTYDGGAVMDFVGLFRDFRNSYEMKNISVVNADIKGRSYVGILAGRMYTCSTCSAENVFTSGRVEGTGDYAGGIVGLMQYKLINGHSTAEVIGGRFVGGLAGRKYYASVLTTFAGSVVANGRTDQHYCYAGGIFGHWDAPVQTISGVWNTGPVTCHMTMLNSGPRHGHYTGGLYGVLGSGNNITIENSYNTGDVSGDYTVGGLVGSGSPHLKNSYNTGKITGKRSSVGGLFGSYASSFNMDKEVADSYNTGDVESLNDGYVGGIVGNTNGGNFQRVYNTGNVVGKSSYTGGLAGSSSHTDYFIYFHDSYNKGTVTGTSYLGGLVGQSRQKIHMSNSYNTGDVTGTGSYVGGIMGHNDYRVLELIDKSYSTGNVEGIDYVGGAFGHLNTGRAGVQVRNSYASGNVVARSYVGGFVGRMVGDNGAGVYSIESSYARGDITATGGQIGGFVGRMESNTSIYRSYAKGNIVGNDSVGGFLGHAYYQNYQIHESYAAGDVTADTYVGGFVGNNYYGRTDNDIADCYATGDVKGSDIVGGFAGRTSDRLTRVLATGKVELNIEGVGSAGGVAGVYYAEQPGGYLGLPGSYWDKDTTGRTSTANDKGTGYPTGPLTDEATYTSWDFVNVWKMPASTGYPVLGWQ